MTRLRKMMLEELQRIPGGVVGGEVRALQAGALFRRFVNQTNSAQV
jgi:hypothetical protein